MNNHTNINQKDLKQLFNHLKNSAKKRNIPFELSVVDLYNLSFPVTCPVLNIPIFFNRGKPEDNSISIDRIDSSKGYLKDNIIVISNRANTLKRDATLAELKQLVEFYSSF